MKKEDFSYGIIYENIKGKKEAINEIESVCPCCGNTDDLKKEENNIGPFRQYIYECNCGTKWRGNFYDENEEVVDYKTIKKTLRKDKRDKFIENVKYNLEESGPYILAFIGVMLVILIFIFVLYKGYIITKSSETEIMQEQIIKEESKPIENSIEKNSTTLKEVEPTENLEKDIVSNQIVEEEKIENETDESEPTFETMNEQLKEVVMMMFRFMMPLILINIMLLFIRRIHGDF